MGWRNRTTVSVPEMARILSISRCLAYELIKSGEVQAIRLGQRRIVVPTENIKRILEEDQQDD